MSDETIQSSSMMSYPKTLVYFLWLLICSLEVAMAQTTQTDVRVVGEMRKVMWMGQLEGVIELDSVASKEHVYGLGPVQYLTGELLLYDGITYRSVVMPDSSMKVEEVNSEKAPFFAYSSVKQWNTEKVPTTIRTMSDLETYIDELTQDSVRPFLFRVSGVVEHAVIHVVNLPEGSEVSSPSEAHQGQVNYELDEEAVEILGFFSTEHKAIFTHHDTYVHMHLMSSDRQMMGHLDEVLFKAGDIKLHLPQN